MVSFVPIKKFIKNIENVQKNYQIEPYGYKAFMPSNNQIHSYF